MTHPFMNYINDANAPVPQTKPENDLQVANNAGGFTFKVSGKSKLERFLILGTTGGTYYVKQNDLTKQNVDWLIALIKANDPDTIKMITDTIVDVSVNGRAYKNSPAIFAAALFMSYWPGPATSVFRRLPDKQLARDVALEVCRTATHVYEFITYVDSMRGWGRSFKNFVRAWLKRHSQANTLAYQAVKYRSRTVAGKTWTLRDLMRLSHPSGLDHRTVEFILGKEPDNKKFATPPIIIGFKKLQSATNAHEAIDVLEAYGNLPWEALPTEVHKFPEVWKQLFYNGQLNGQALIRNITRLARLGAFNDMVFARDYANKLTDVEMIRRTKLHPINYLNALVTYTDGQVNRNDRSGGWGYSSARTKDWSESAVIRNALNEGFYLSFKTIEPANKRTLLGLDISGSMSSQALGIDLSCAQVTAAMSMVTARTEPYYHVMGFAYDFIDLNIGPNMDLNATMKHVQRNNFGSTDCSLPMTWALKNKIEVDTFAVYTDNETYAGRIHPHKALEEYRQKMGRDARLAVVGIAANDFSIANPRDKGMMDFCGFDSNSPKVLADFSSGRI